MCVQHYLVYSPSEAEASAQLRVTQGRARNRGDIRRVQGSSLRSPEGLFHQASAAQRQTMITMLSARQSTKITGSSHVSTTTETSPTLVPLLGDTRTPAQSSGPAAIFANGALPAPGPESRPRA